MKTEGPGLFIASVATIISVFISVGIFDAKETTGFVIAGATWLIFEFIFAFGGKNKLSEPKNICPHCGKPKRKRTSNATRCSYCFKSWSDSKSLD